MVARFGADASSGGCGRDWSVGSGTGAAEGRAEGPPLGARTAVGLGTVIMKRLGCQFW